MSNKVSIQSKKVGFRMLYIFVAVFTVAFVFAFTIIPKSKVVAQQNQDDQRMEWELTKIIIDDRARIEQFSPSAARDTYLDRTGDIIDKRMVMISEYSDIQKLAHEANMHEFNRVLREKGIETS